MKKFILLMLMVILTACSAAAPTDLDRNRQTWQDAGVPHYRFDLFIGCFCVFRDHMPLAIEVQNGEIISMTKPDGTSVEMTDPSYELFAKYATIDRIFSELETGLKGDADEVTVTYDATYGFPSEIYFDFIREAADDELSIQVSNFEALK
ncbi:MAG: hypothetical protein JNM02_05175 [Anaerolineales bacterium]|nr:hypothetical protein [Anaerolineales bacterium]